MTFVFRHVDGKQPWVLNLLIPDSYEPCLAHIVANMQHMGVGVEKNTKNERKTLREADVTKEAIAAMDIEQILEHVAAYEADSEMTLQTVQTLTALYQKVVEYYSAFDDLLYNDYISRMHSLLQREDIQAVMGGTADLSSA